MIDPIHKPNISHNYDRSYITPLPFTQAKAAFLPKLPKKVEEATEANIKGRALQLSWWIKKKWVVSYIFIGYEHIIFLSVNIQFIIIPSTVGATGNTRRLRIFLDTGSLDTKVGTFVPFFLSFRRNLRHHMCLWPLGCNTCFGRSPNGQALDSPYQKKLSMQHSTCKIGITGKLKSLLLIPATDGILVWFCTQGSPSQALPVLSLNQWCNKKIKQVETFLDSQCSTLIQPNSNCGHCGGGNLNEPGLNGSPESAKHKDYGPLQYMTA